MKNTVESENKIDFFKVQMLKAFKHGRKFELLETKGEMDILNYSSTSFFKTAKEPFL